MAFLVTTVVIFHRLIPTFLKSIIHSICDLSVLTSKKYNDILLSFTLEGDGARGGAVG